MAEPIDGARDESARRVVGTGENRVSDSQAWQETRAGEIDDLSERDTDLVEHPLRFRTQRLKADVVLGLGQRCLPLAARVDGFERWLVPSCARGVAAYR